MKLTDIVSKEIDRLKGVDLDADRLEYFLINLREVAQLLEAVYRQSLHIALE